MSERVNESEESKQLKKDLLDKINSGAQYIQDHILGDFYDLAQKSKIASLNNSKMFSNEITKLNNITKKVLSDKEIYEQIIKASESIPHLEPVQAFIVGGSLFSALKSSPEFTQEGAPNIASTITAMLGDITIICNDFIKNDDPNIYQFKDGKLTIVATVTGLDNI